MLRMKIVGVSFVGLVCTLLLASNATAQQSLSGIAGAVKDAAGTPVAGVTVEVASPALIERVRTVVTDGQGQYKVLDLQPAVYTVTFKAAGFNTSLQTAYGSTWLKPTKTLDARLVQVSDRIDF